MGKTTHGMRQTKYYGVWSAMVRRCESSNVPEYHYYGGRGIRVCTGLRNFIGYRNVMGDTPEGGELDRENNDGHYSCGACDMCLTEGWPKNVRWVDNATQLRNRSCTVLYTHAGESKTLSEWAERTGLTKACLKSRLYLYKWPVERALTTPARERNA